ncbi:unnamed protein product [Mycena citricolor]|uniref:Phosphatidylinositol N-acetylglucosaminyltransferase subunit H conserved domain-containing protein n=1 Tax=Mycena citricolor TaxID=2018698 RepID=A0AAD2K424_9AGAR|nr:unnamed protein product [Mycena citricolor]
MVSPEFSVHVHSSFIEYRVENWHISRDGTGKRVMGATTWTWYHPFIALAVAVIWPYVRDDSLKLLALTLGVMLLIYRMCTQVLFESVIVVKSHGIQLETHRGMPGLPPLAVRRRFLPFSSLQDFVIHEGLSGWNVRYYLAAIVKTDADDYKVDVAFENILPHFPILREVYLGVQDELPA